MKAKRLYQSPKRVIECEIIDDILLQLKNYKEMQNIEGLEEGMIETQRLINALKFIRF